MRIALVPGVLALLPEYAGQVDPVAELRAAALGAVAWLGADVEIYADEQGERVARHLLDARGVSTGSTSEAGILVVGNGSAKRTERAPGHLDERAAAFDTALGESLWRGRPEVDPALAEELWADVAGIMRLPGPLGEATVDYADDPFGVQYWVMRWTCAS